MAHCPAAKRHVTDRLHVETEAEGQGRVEGKCSFGAVEGHECHADERVEVATVHHRRVHLERATCNLLRQLLTSRAFSD